MTNQMRIAEAYAQGRIDAGEPAFMDTDNFTSNVTTGAFAYAYETAVAQGREASLVTAWGVFMATSGRTVVHDDVDTPEDEMATVAEVHALRVVTDPCMITRTYLGGPTGVRCHLHLGHQDKHAAMIGGRTFTWTTAESDQALNDRIRYVPASTHSTLVTRTAYPVVASDEQVSAAIPVKQEV